MSETNNNQDNFEIRNGVKYYKEPSRPQRMVYCKKCTYPIISVNLTMDDKGVCSGCIVNEEKFKLDWEEREKEFKEILLSYKAKKTSNYDCIIPVSGGKDSHFQVMYVKEMGLNPLLVTYYGHNYPEVGEQNLKNIGSAFGCDHLIFRPSIKTVQKLNRAGLEITGDMNWHNHCGLYTYPFNIAVKFGVPLVIYGEHGLDLAGNFSFYDKPEFTKRERLEEDLRGYDWDTFLNYDGLTEDDLKFLQIPSDEEIEKIGIRGLYMGLYIFWDGNRNGLEMQKYGFKESPEPFERTYRRYSNLDDIHENGLHDYLKFIKFGYGRATDHTSKDIRLGEMSRSKGVELVRQYDHVFPLKSMAHFSKMTDIDQEEFMAIADKFRDPRVWWIDKDGNWKKDNIWD